MFRLALLFIFSLDHMHYIGQLAKICFTLSSITKFFLIHKTLDLGFIKNHGGRKRWQGFAPDIGAVVV